MSEMLTENQSYALYCLDLAERPIGGNTLASRMTRAGHRTTVQAAHRAGSALAQKGLAGKAQEPYTLRVVYEITNAGRDLIKASGNPLRVPGGIQ